MQALSRSMFSSYNDKPCWKPTSKTEINSAHMFPFPYNEHIAIVASCNGVSLMNLSYPRLKLAKWVAITTCCSANPKFDYVMCEEQLSFISPEFFHYLT